MGYSRTTEVRTSIAILAVVGTLAACGGPGAPDLAVSLEPGEMGFVDVVITNAGPSTVRFLDVREGSSLCSAFWQVDVQLRGGAMLNASMTYNTSDIPVLVSLEPGQTHRRQIHPVAYVEPYQPQPEETAILTVRYRVRNPDRWRGWIDDATLSFASRPLVIRLADFL